MKIRRSVACGSVNYLLRLSISIRPLQLLEAVLEEFMERTIEVPSTKQEARKIKVRFEVPIQAMNVFIFYIWTPFCTKVNMRAPTRIQCEHKDVSNHLSLRGVSWSCG